MNFTSISSKSILGRMMRFPLKFIPAGMDVPILQGKLRGSRWIVGSFNHGCWLGSYEHEKQSLFAETVTEGAVVYDIGAHVGFYTLLASQIVGQRGKVIAFEPLPRNLFYLNKHLLLNKCENVQVIEAAVAEDSGTAIFAEGIHSSMGHLSSAGNIEIQKVALDELVLKGRIPPPEYLKIDVEGAELLVLSGAKKTLHDFAPVIFLSTHGVDIHRQCIEFLKSTGYQLHGIVEKSTYYTDEIIAVKK
jgi:FkbM family methyltransferase